MPRCIVVDFEARFEGEQGDFTYSVFSYVVALVIRVRATYRTYKKVCGVVEKNAVGAMVGAAMPRIIFLADSCPVRKISAFERF